VEKLPVFRGIPAFSAFALRPVPAMCSAAARRETVAGTASRRSTPSRASTSAASGPPLDASMPATVVGRALVAFVKRGLAKPCGDGCVA